MTHPSRQDGQSLRDELMAKIQLQREVILNLCDRVERLEMRADGLTPMERVERRWANESAGGYKLEQAAGPAVPDDREPAAVAGEPSDEELLELMPQQFRDDLATVTRMAAHNAGTGVTAGLFRVTLDTGVLEYARAVLARWGRQPSPLAVGEMGELADRLGRIADGVRDMGWEQDAGTISRAAKMLQQRHPEPVPVSERLPVDVEQALITAECALSDIAEGEPEENENDADALLQWAEQRAARALSRIRPVMRGHGILTSEWPPLPATALPLPQQETPND